MKNEQKISSSTYPYINARVRGMKSKLIKKEDYEKLLHMGLEEFVHFLEENDYKKEIDSLAMCRKGSDLINRAVSKNFSKTMKKLKKISDGTPVNVLIKGYLKRWSIWNIKVIIRGKYAGESPETINAFIMDLNDPKVKISELIAEDVSIEEVLEKTGLIKNCSRMSKAIENFHEKNSLFYIENCLDLYYYNFVITFAKKIPLQEIFIQRFIETEVDALNIKAILTMKRENFSKEEIKKNIISYNFAIGKQKIWRSLIDAENVEAMFEFLSTTKYWSLIEHGVEVFRKTNKLSTIESGLEKHILEHGYLLLHQHPLSISPIIGYMIAKRVEMKNLGMLARSKEVNLDENFMRSHLVIAGV